MGVAYNPNGNGGDGSFWVAKDHGSWGDNGSLYYASDDADDDDWLEETFVGPTNVDPILEIDGEGNVLTELINNPNTNIPNKPDGTPHPSGGWWGGVGGIEIDPQTGNLWLAADLDERIMELDPTTGMPTGIAYRQFVSEPGRVGGLVGIPGGDPDPNGSFLRLRHGGVHERGW